MSGAMTNPAHKSGAVGFDAMRGLLAAMATVPGDPPKIKVDPGGSPRYDPNEHTIYVPCYVRHGLSEDMILAARAYFDHELGEAEISDWAKKLHHRYGGTPNIPKGLIGMTNAIGDVRVDTEQGRKWPGAKLNIIGQVEADYSELVAHNKRSPIDPEQAGTGFIASICRYVGDGVTTLPEVYSEFPQFADSLDLVRDKIENLTFEDEWEIIFQAEDIYYTLRDVEPPSRDADPEACQEKAEQAEDEQDQQGQGNPGGAGDGEQTGQGGGSAGDSGESGQSGSSGNNGSGSGNQQGASDGSGNQPNAGNDSNTGSTGDSQGQDGPGSGAPPGTQEEADENPADTLGAPPTSGGGSKKPGKLPPTQTESVEDRLSEKLRQGMLNEGIRSRLEPERLTDRGKEVEKNPNRKHNRSHLAKRDREHPYDRYGGALATRLRQALQAPAPRYKQRQEFGSVDPKRITQLAIGQKRVMRRKTRQNSNSVAVTVSMDTSGSMGSQLGILYDLSQVWGRTCDRLDLPLQVRTWEGDMSTCSETVLKEFDEDFASVKKRLGHLAVGGGTPTAVGLASAAEDIAKRPEQKKVIFLLTDGVPNRGREHYEYLRDMLRECRKQNILVVGLGIGVDEPHGVDFECWERVDSAKDLVYRASKKLVRILRLGRC